MVYAILSHIKCRYTSVCHYCAICNYVIIKEGRSDREIGNCKVIKENRLIKQVVKQIKLFKRVANLNSYMLLYIYWALLRFNNLVKNVYLWKSDFISCVEEMRVNALQNYREKISTSDMCHNRMCVCVCEKKTFLQQ